MAELDAASIFLIILAVVIAPWVVPVILRILGGEAEAMDEQRERAIREDPRGK